jgi:hypothetical protein
VGAAANDIWPSDEEKKRRDAGLMPRTQTGEPSGGPAWEAAMKGLTKQDAEDKAADQAGQAARDLKTKRAAEGKIRY